MHKTISPVIAFLSINIFLSLQVMKLASASLDTNGASVNGKIYVVKKDISDELGQSVEQNYLQFCDNDGKILREIKLRDSLRDDFQYVRARELVYVPQRLRNRDLSEDAFGKPFEAKVQLSDLNQRARAFVEMNKYIEDIDVYSLNGELKRSIHVGFRVTELFANPKGDVAVRGIIDARGIVQGYRLAFYDQNGNLRREYDELSSKELRLPISGKATGMGWEENGFVWVGDGVIALIGYDGNVVWRYRNKAISVASGIPWFARGLSSGNIGVYIIDRDGRGHERENLWYLNKKGKMTNWHIEERELKPVDISPRLRLIKAVDGKGGFGRVLNKTIQFVNEAGLVSREMDCQNGFGFSNNKRFVAVAQQYRERYSWKDFEEMRQKAKQQKKNYTHPKDFWDPLVNVDVFDENGVKIETVKADMFIRRILCGDDGHLVVYGHGHLDRNGYFKICFYDETGKLTKSISNSDAIERGLAFYGDGIFLKDGKVLWGGEFIYGKGGAFILYDRNGEILSMAKEEDFSTNDLHFEESADSQVVLIKATKRDGVTRWIHWTWAINPDGEIVDNWEGWGDDNKVVK